MAKRTDLLDEFESMSQHAEAVQAEAGVVLARLQKAVLFGDTTGDLAMDYLVAGGINPRNQNQHLTTVREFVDKMTRFEGEVFVIVFEGQEQTVFSMLPGGEEFRPVVDHWLGRVLPAPLTFSMDVQKRVGFRIADTVAMRDGGSLNHERAKDGVFWEPIHKLCDPHSYRVTPKAILIGDDEVQEHFARRHHHHELGFMMKELNYRPAKLHPLMKEFFDEMDSRVTPRT